MKARDVMTSDVVSIGPDASILEALRLMLDRRISGLPVLDAQQRLVGIVTEGDFLHRAETGTERRHRGLTAFLMGPGRLADEYVRTHGRKVAEVMTPDPVTITEDAPLDAIVDLMERRHMKRFPVMRDGRVVGIVSRANLLHALAALTRKPRAANTSDAAVREQVLTALTKESWAPKHAIDVVVHNGVVELWGSIFDERERAAVRVVAENVSGVKEVKDHLVWVEPMSGMVFEPPSDAPQRSTSA
jgi:CBS-domain-containing membrane protein